MTSDILNAIIAFLVAWLFYRISKSSERYSVIASLISELKVHNNWMSGDYPPKTTPASWKNISYLVLKLSTVAIDLTIEKAGALFLNPKLIVELTNYRQGVESFNQLVDSAMNFQSNSELWRNKNVDNYKKRMVYLTERIHKKGVGSSLDSDSARATFVRLTNELAKEAGFKGWFHLVIWFSTGFNFYTFYCFTNKKLRM